MPKKSITEVKRVGRNAEGDKIMSGRFKNRREQEED